MNDQPVILIPARLASTRLPRKPLANIAGLPMIVQVWHRAMEADCGRVVVAAAGTEIVDANLITNGGRVLTISGIGENKDALKDVVYEKMRLVKFKGKHFRNDIGLTEVRQK